MKISVVVPTYNRNRQLSGVLDHLLASDADGFDDIEIIIVDDGSSESAKSVVVEKSYCNPFRLKYLYQSNSGPAAARNNGFRQAANDTVLFIDDDVLVSGTLLCEHAQAHLDKPGSVIFGLYPYITPAVETPSYRYLDLIERLARAEVAEGNLSGYVKSNIVASGNLSVEKSIFDNDSGVYDETLKTPMSEELELAIRLSNQKIPVYYAPHIEALHTQPTTIEGKCMQDYKYGYGIAEAYSRLADIAPPEQFAYTMLVNGKIRSDDPFKLKTAKVVKSVLGSKTGRAVFLKFVKILEFLIPGQDKILFSFYRKVVGVHYFAGIRDGLRKYSKDRLQSRG